MVTILASFHSWISEPPANACISISKLMVSVAHRCFHILLGIPSTPEALPSAKEAIARCRSSRVGISSSAVFIQAVGWSYYALQARYLLTGWAILSYYLECSNERDIHQALIVDHRFLTSLDIKVLYLSGMASTNCFFFKLINDTVYIHAEPFAKSRFENVFTPLYSGIKYTHFFRDL